MQCLVGCVWLIRNFNIAGYAALEQFNELLVHKCILIRNAETDDPFADQFGCELGLQSSQMLFLHDKNNISPADMSRRYLNAGIFFCSGRPYLIRTIGFKNLFCGKTAPLVPAAYK